MKINKQNYIIYFGLNSFYEHKRGVENVIDFQSKAFYFDKIYYVHWGSKTTAYKNKKFICVSIKHCWYWPILLNMVLLIIYRKKKVIIHSHNSLFSFCSIFKTDIFTVHDGLYYLNKSKKGKFNFLFFIVEKFIYYRCTIVHFISNYTKEQSLFGNCKNFVIIPNTSHFEHAVISTNDAQIISNIKNILIVRSIEERARIDLLLEVAEKQIGIYNFIVAGKGPLLENYREIIKSKRIDNVILLGYVEDKELLMLYANCDLVLMIAEYGEGFGLPIIEGYLFNKPVIASNKCAIPEVIISKEYLFENNSESIIQSLKFASNNLHNNYRDYYDRNFSNAVVLSKFKDLYSNTFI